MKIAFLSSMFLAVSLPAFAASSPIVVSDGWMRSLPGNLPAGGYFVLRNDSDKSVTLTGASSPACGMLMLHKSESMSGTMQMDDVQKIDVPPGGTLRFSPGGYHLMCMNPTSAMKVGSKIPVTLQFGDGMALRQSFDVRNAAGH